MACYTKSELGWKQKSKENVTLGAKLFGFVRNVYTKMKRSKSEDKISAYVVAETAKAYEIRAEQETTKATYLLVRNTRTI